jgi:thioredoxin 1
MMTNITAQNFQREVVESELPVLVDFWASWCMPCRVLSPVLDRISVEYTGKIKLVASELDDEGKNTFPQKYGIQNVPTVILFIKGEEVARCIGLVGKDKIIAMFQKYIS